jgi:hypothetical protein
MTFLILNSWRAGVIWKGDKLIDGVPETLDLLRAKVSPELREVLPA